ncbi:MAG: HD family phosphohydrolase, partial [Clostridiales bacterium]|nr:HD family phosphohydrolase [Clostridiales bacterium]
SDSSHRLHGYRHPGFAVRNAQRLYGPLSMMAENIIKRHMWPLTPTPPKYKEAFIVSFVDKYCTAQEIILTKTKRMPVRQK